MHIDRDCEKLRGEEILELRFYHSILKQLLQGREIGRALGELREFYFLSNVLKRQEVLRLKIEEL